MKGPFSFPHQTVELDQHVCSSNAYRPSHVESVNRLGCRLWKSWESTSFLWSCLHVVWKVQERIFLFYIGGEKKVYHKLIDVTMYRQATARWWSRSRGFQHLQDQESRQAEKSFPSSSYLVTERLSKVHSLDPCASLGKFHAACLQRNLHLNMFVPMALCTTTSETLVQTAFMLMIISCHCILHIILKPLRLGR